MTDQGTIINFIHGKLSSFLYKIGMIELDYCEDESIEFPLKGYKVKISISLKKIK